MQVLFAISVTANTAPTIYSCGLSSFVVFPFLAKGEQANVTGLSHPFLTYLLQCRGTSWPSRSLPYISPSLCVSSFGQHRVQVTNCCFLYRSSVQITVCPLRSWIRACGSDSFALFAVFVALENFLAILAYWTAMYIPPNLIEPLIIRRPASILTYPVAIWNDRSKLPVGYAAIAGMCCVSLTTSCIKTTV